MQEIIKFSPSKLNLLNDCPRCFFNQEKYKISRPRGAFPSLPGGIDSILKKHYDNYRGKLPSEIRNYIKGSLYSDMEKLKKMRFWKTGLCYMDKKTGAILSGALDDLIVEPTKTFSPLDYKTKGADPKTNGAEYYQTQLDCYACMLDANDMPASGKAYLIYYWPLEIHTDQVDMEEGSVQEIIVKGQSIHFGVTPFELETKKERIVELLRKAVDILNGKRPAASEKCECRYYKLVPQVDSKSKKELFQIEDDAVGRASKEFVLLARAKKEISNHLNDLMVNLIAELRKVKRNSISFQAGSAIVTLSIKHVDAKEVIVIEK